MTKKKTMVTASLVLGSLGLLGSQQVSASTDYAPLGSGAQVRDQLMENQITAEEANELIAAGEWNWAYGEHRRGGCRSGKCGSGRKSAEGKCGEGTCGGDNGDNGDNGDDSSNDPDGIHRKVRKTSEEMKRKNGGNGKTSEGKCGEGTCGG